MLIRWPPCDVFSHVCHVVVPTSSPFSPVRVWPSLWHSGSPLAPSFLFFASFPEMQKQYLSILANPIAPFFGVFDLLFVEAFVVTVRDDFKRSRDPS